MPLFVFDDAILGSSYNRPNRTGFLVESLVDLDDALRALGGALVVRRGEWVREVAAVVDEVGADSVHVSDDVSGYARARSARLADAVPVPIERRAGDHGGRTGRDHAGLRPCRRGRPLQGVHAVLPPLVRGAPSPRGARAGPLSRCPTASTRAPCRSSTTWSTATAPRTSRRGAPTPGTPSSRRGSSRGCAAYADHHDDLPGDATSRLSPYLHFGCLSPLEALRAAGHHQGEGPDAFVRQLCWRDFYAQVLAARPDAAWSDYVDRGDRWRDDPAARRRGRRAAPATRSSTPACASSVRRV